MLLLVDGTRSGKHLVEITAPACRVLSFPFVDDHREIQDFFNQETRKFRSRILLVPNRCEYLPHCCEVDLWGRDLRDMSSIFETDAIDVFFENSFIPLLSF